jgi:hypothetical protein
MESESTSAQRRKQLEMMLKEVVLAIRADRGDGNITLRIPESGDFVAILRVDDVEAHALTELLGSGRG